MDERTSPNDSMPREESPKIDKRVKNFSALLKARAKAEAKAEQQQQQTQNTSSAFTPLSSGNAPTAQPRQGSSSRPSSSASTVRPDSVLSFRSEIPNVSNTTVPCQTNSSLTNTPWPFVLV